MLAFVLRVIYWVHYIHLSFLQVGICFWAPILSGNIPKNRSKVGKSQLSWTAMDPALGWFPLGCEEVTVDLKL